MGLLERREVSAEELTAAYLAAIDERDPELHAYLRTVGLRSGAHEFAGHINVRRANERNTEQPQWT